MSNLNSLLTIVLVLAAIIVPQVLMVYLSESSKSEHEEEFVPDGR